MEVKDFALQNLDGLQTTLKEAVDGLTQEEIMWQPKPGANHIAYILWHTLRVEDSFFQNIFRRVPTLWESEKWHERLNLPEDPRDTGFGYTAEQVDGFPSVRLSDLLAYGESVRACVVDYIRSVDPAKFDEIVKSRFFGEVSYGYMLNRVTIEIALHVGQIAYLRGLIKGQGE